MDIEEYVKGVVPKEMYSAWNMEALKAQACAARTYALATTKHKAAGYDVCTTTCCQVYSTLRTTRTNQAVEETRGIVGLYKGVIVPTFFSARCGGHTLNSWDTRYLKSVPCGCQGGVYGHRQGLCQYGAQAWALAGKDYKYILNYYYNLDWVGDYGAGEREEEPVVVNPPTSPDYSDADKVRIVWNFLMNKVEFTELNGRQVLAKKTGNTYTATNTLTTEEINAILNV
jgi:hypothetical protein